MAHVTLQKYNVDGTVIQERYWPNQDFSADAVVSETLIDHMADGIATEINSYLVSIGLDPSTIDDAANPYAYAWLQETLGLGIAARVGRALTGADPELSKYYSKEFEKRMKQLRTDADAVLGDWLDDSGVPNNDVRSHVKKLGLVDTRVEEDEYTSPFKIGDDL